MVKYGGGKAMDLLKRGGKSALEAIRGPQGRLGAMKVLMTEINNKIATFDTQPTSDDMAEINEKMDQVWDLLSAETTENPELPSRIQREVERLDQAIVKLNNQIDLEDRQPEELF